jgi:tripartite-type tricarboxylate transporter receptor subunit TctC
MHRRAGHLLLAIIGLVLIAGVAHATTHEFYKGKTVRIVVGAAAGGGFDTYARILARHMGRRIPGNPTIIVENMPGAGSLISANYTYKLAKPDGLTIGHFLGGLFLEQLFGKPGVEFDARKFEYLGVPVKDDPACVFTRASGITSFEKWMAAKPAPKLGGVGPGTATDNIPKILAASIGVPIQLVSGYKGTAVIRLAAESGEVAGGCWAWESLKATWRKGIDAGEVAVVLQMQSQPHPELSNVPLAISFAKSDEARQLIKHGIQDMAAINRPFVLTPGTPKDRVQLLRKAFAETLKDPEFLVEAEKSKLEVDPVTGEDLERTVLGLARLNPALLARLKEVLK